MKSVWSLTLLFCAASLSAQISHRYNSIRPGDELIKQQVVYKDPGRDGANVVWDFGRLESVNDEYSLVYSEAHLGDDAVFMIGRDSVRVSENETVIIATEHHTMYYFLDDGQRLSVLGHENPTTLLRYTQPLTVGIYPTDYSDNFKGSYCSEGVYSGRIPFAADGDISLGADAYGMMVLPSGDTLMHVMRVKTVQTIRELPNEYSTEGKEKMNRVETYRWYSKGYRYPIFETISNMNVSDGKDIFSTAFFFPPQDHLYLDDDPDNLAVLDSLWNIKPDGQEWEDSDGNMDTKPKLTYNFFPNPVDDYLNIEYYLERETAVIIELYGLDGRLVQRVNRAKQAQGIYREQLECSNLTKGTYILRINVNSNQPTTDKIIKK